MLEFFLTPNETTEVPEYLNIKETTPTSYFKGRKKILGDITEKEIPTCISVYQGYTEYSFANS